MENFRKRLLLLFFSIILLINLGVAQTGGGSSAETWQGMDNLFPNSNVEDSGDFLNNVLLPFAGMMAILYFVLLSVFNWASDNMPQGADTVPRRSATVLSAALSLLVLRYYPLGIFAVILSLAGIGAILWGLYKLYQAITGGGNTPTTTGGNSPDVNANLVNATGGPINPGISSDDLQMQIKVSDNSGSGLNELTEINFDGDTMTHTLSGPTENLSIPVSNIKGGSTTIPAGSYSYKAIAEDNNGNTGSNSGFLNVSDSSGGPGGGDQGPEITINADDGPSGANASSIGVMVDCKARGGANLQALEIKVPSIAGGGSINPPVGGNSANFTDNLNTILGGGDPVLPDGTHTIKATVEDSNNEKNYDTAKINIGNVGGGPGSGGGNQQQQQMMQAILGGAGGQAPNIDINLAQQQFQFMMQMMQQQQMMGGMATPAMAQFGNFIQGNVQIGNGNVMIPGQGGSQGTQVDIQVVQQLIQVLSQTEVNEEVFMSIMAILLIKGDQGLNQQLIQQIIDIDIEENQGDLTIEQELIQIIDTDHIKKIENTFENIRKNEYNLYQEQKKFALQINSFFQALHTTSFDIEGDQVIININNAGKVKIRYALLLELLKLIDHLPKSGISVLIHQIINKIIIDGSQSSFNVEVIREIIQIIKVVDEGGGAEGDAPKQANIKIEALNLLSNESGNPVPRVRAEESNYFYVIPAGAKTDMVAIHAQVGCNRKNGLQQIVYSFDNQQKSIGLNDSSYGYEDEEMVNVNQIIGDGTFQQGDKHSFGITVIGQAGNRQDKVMQIYVAGPGGTIQPDNPPGFPPGDTKQPPELISDPDRKGVSPDDPDSEDVGKTEETIEREKGELKAVIRAAEQEHQDLNKLLEDLQEALNWYEKVKEDIKEIEKVHKMLEDGATLQDLNNKQKKIIQGDIDEIKEGMDALMTLRDDIRSEIARIKEEESDTEDHIVQIEKEDQKIEIGVKELEHYVKKLDDLMDMR